MPWLVHPEATRAATPNAPRSWLRRLAPWLVALGALLVLTVGAALAIIVVVVDWLDSPTRSLSDFETNVDAVNFVSEHLPTSLPPGVVVTELTYERWQDWRLEATVAFDTRADTATFLKKLRAASTTNAQYCGPPSTATTASYFLPKWHACGSVTADSQSVVRVLCTTR